jgi:predicted RNA binding protein YcfA (HicA-like mRNA interferase family)
MKELLGYEIKRQKGSHRLLISRNGYPQLMFSFHDGATVPPGAVRKILTKDAGLHEDEARHLL